MNACAAPNLIDVPVACLAEARNRFREVLEGLRVMHECLDAAAEGSGTLSRLRHVHTALEKARAALRPGAGRAVRTADPESRACLDELFDLVEQAGIFAREIRYRFPQQLVGSARSLSTGRKPVPASPTREVRG